MTVPSEAASAARSARVAVLDYGSGNLRSAVQALRHVGADAYLVTDADEASEADGLVVPGVGSFAACMASLEAAHAGRIIGRRLAGGRPVLGICVGMQVMFEAGLEAPVGAVERVRTPGLGEWPGEVRRLEAEILPHMGWSHVSPPAGTRLFAGIESERFYFVHSYAATELDLGPEGSSAIPRPMLTWSQHGEPFIAAVENGALSATQFHPERSGDAGLALLRNWLETL